MSAPVIAVGWLCWQQCGDRATQPCMCWGDTGLWGPRGGWLGLAGFLSSRRQPLLLLGVFNHIRSVDLPKQVTEAWVQQILEIAWLEMNSTHHQGNLNCCTRSVIKITLSEAVNRPAVSVELPRNCTGGCLWEDVGWSYKWELVAGFSLQLVGCCQLQQAAEGVEVVSVT